MVCVSLIPVPRLHPEHETLKSWEYGLGTRLICTAIRPGHYGLNTGSDRVGLVDIYTRYTLLPGFRAYIDLTGCIYAHTSNTGRGIDTIVIKCVRGEGGGGGRGT